MVTDKSPDQRDIDKWFVEEVLSLETALIRFLSYHWHDKAEVSDLRQEVYLRLYEAAKNERPAPIKPYLFSVARNLMIDRIRQKNIVPIASIADIEWSSISDGQPNPEQRVSFRQELRRMQQALDELAPRCRQAILLRRVHGYSQREVAAKMGIKEETVEHLITRGMRVLADAALDKRGSLIAGARRLLGKQRS